MTMYNNVVELQDVNKPRNKHIRVALNCVHRCPMELTEEMTDVEVTKADEESVSTVSDEQNLVVQVDKLEELFKDQMTPHSEDT